MPQPMYEGLKLKTYVCWMAWAKDGFSSLNTSMSWEIRNNSHALHPCMKCLS